MKSESEKTGGNAATGDNPPEVRGFAPATDLVIGFMFMSRLPTPAWRNRPLSKAAWCFPLVGLTVGLIGGGAYWLAHLMLLPPWIAAILAITATVFATGALHEDGFSDAADGLWGGYTPERRLEIMRDSNIGGYGALALVLNICLRAGALAALADPLIVATVMVAAHSLSRANVVWIMAALPLAGKSGLAATAGKPVPAIAAIAMVMGLVLSALSLGHFLPPLILPVVLAAPVALAWAFMMLVKDKTGGYNGDALGASQQIGEITLLLAVLSASQWTTNSMGLS